MKQAPGAKIRESIDMGDFKGTSRDLDNILRDLRQIFRGSDYHILSKNCNAFADEFLKRTVGKELPGYVNRLAFVGSMFSCLLPQSLTNAAPVNGMVENGSSSSSSSSMESSRAMKPAFQGQGFKLGEEIQSP